MKYYLLTLCFASLCWHSAYCQEMAAQYNLAGQEHLRIGRNDLAEEAFKEALSLATKDSETAANSLNNLAIVYWNMGNNSQALTYMREALDIRKKLFKAGSEAMAASYNDLGLIYSNIDPEKALKYYQLALDSYQKMYGNQHEKTAQAIINIGIIYNQLMLYGNAVNNFNDALSIWEALYPDGHPNQGFTFTNLGRTSELRKEYNTARAYYQKAYDIYLTHYGEKHPEIAATLNLIGNTWNAEGEFETALEYYQKALIANSTHFDNTDLETNPPVNSYFRANTLLNSLFYKAKALEDYHYYKTLKFNDLKMSLYTLQACDTLIDKIRQLSHNEADKLALGNISSSIYEFGVSLLKGMGDVALKKDEYYGLCFYFAEKSKSAILLEAISDASAKAFAGIPAEALSKEQELKTSITYYEQLLAKTLAPTEAEEYRSKLFTLRNDYTAFVSQLETKYPDYYNLKYNVATPTISQLQEKLKENEVILSYFSIADKQRFFIFEIGKKKYKITNVPQPDNFYRYISGLRNSIYYQEDSIYRVTATAMKDILIPKLDKKIEHLIIIPEGKLGTLPYESLLMEVPTSDDFDSYEYLVKQYDISYQYSTTLFYQQKTWDKSQNAAFLCAPVYFSGLATLPGTRTEVNALHSIFSNKMVTTEICMETKATESYLKKNDLSSYKYLHLATHGVVNESKPELSCIYLNAEGHEDGNLYSGEIFNLNLHADLITLSACQTGLGKVSKSEGIIGLSRALLYAGANNLVVSLWNVADQSTSALMIDFYTKITDSNYSAALRQAKLDMIKEKTYAHPYYWAPFILIGR